MTEAQFSKTYDQMADAIFRHCYFRLGEREQAIDCMQETFLKVWSYLTKGKTIDNVKAFLYRTATNLIIDHVRKQKNRQEVSLEDLRETGWDVESPEDPKQTTSALDAKNIYRVLNKLDDKHKDIVIMRYINDLKPAEIADALGLSANVVSVRINRGLKELRSLLPNE